MKILNKISKKKLEKIPGMISRTERERGIKPWRLVRQQPTKEGFYWFRVDDQHILSIIEVFVEHGEWSVRTGKGIDDTNFLSNYVGEWAGLIPRPRNE